MQLTIYYLMWIVFFGGIDLEGSPSLFSHELNTLTETNQNSNCRLQDSIILVDLYLATTGPGWTNSWNLNQPMDNWDGIILNAAGCVEEVRLSDRNLDGTLPNSLGNFSALKLLHLDNNNLQNQIPSGLGNLSDLQILFLDDNNFIGTIPEQLGNITTLNTLFLDNNQLEGPIPTSFLNLMNLIAFDFFGNKIDSLPDLSSITTLIIQNNRFRVMDNALTFDDILPNMSSSLGENYHPQDSVFQEITYNLTTGENFEINLEIDEGLTSSNYVWHKNGVYHSGPYNSPKLPFTGIKWSDAGVYNCTITNPNAELLTLYSRPVTLQISCGISEEQLGGDYCGNESIVVNGTTYNQANPSGMEYLSIPDQYGCDSLVVINMNFNQNATSNFIEEVCSDETYLINGTTYNATNPTGTETLWGQAFNGCDSIVNVNLSIGAASENNIDEILCPTESIFINGKAYNLANPAGSETFQNQSYTGCDSIVNVNLDFHPLAEGWYDRELCAGSSFILNGNTFNASNPTGAVTLSGQSFHNCDSVVYVNLTFSNAITEAYNPTLCSGESIVINGTTYDWSNQSGSELFPMGSYIGCDSIVNVELDYHVMPEGFINETLCEDESVTVGDITFDFLNRSGAVILDNSSQYGCDSAVFINLSFFPKIEIDYNELICFGEIRVINGTTYDQNNPTGIEILPGEQFVSCDSTMNINLTFLPLAESFINEPKCSNETVEINGMTFDIDNPTGAVALPGAGFNGCDSTIYINLQYQEASEKFINELLCADEIREVNGVTYDANNPMGAEYFPGQNVYGCDSTVYVNLQFLPIAERFVNNTLCSGTSLNINGTNYNETNATGTEFLPGQGFNGCDSTIYIDLIFSDAVINEQSEMICAGGSIVVNGVTYDANNPTGSETFPMGSFIGCDSIVNVNLSFYNSPARQLNPILCGNESFEINGTIYNETNLTGTEILPEAAYLGCDSIVEISLSYFQQTASAFEPLICADHFVMVNEVTYDITNPTGTEILSEQSFYGCDSVINISLQFHETEVGTYTPSTCTGGSIQYNGTTYNESNPTGTEILVGQSFYGCDSTVNVAVTFASEITADVFDTLCDGESMLINGVTYDSSNPTGMEQMISSNGCDSIVMIDLNFANSSNSIISDPICNSEEIVVNGTIYSATNPTGTEILQNASYTGCDSIVTIDLMILLSSGNNIDTTICAGNSLEIQGTILDAANPIGIIELDETNYLGCDSFLVINLSFLENEAGIYEDMLCADAMVEINGTTYDIDNPTGTETIAGANYLGCDSTIQVNLQFTDAIEGDYFAQVCSGETVSINGTIYNESNSSGTEIIPGGSFLGCDSIVNVSLQFLTATPGTYSQQICNGQNVIINGTTYDVTNPTGTEIFENANYLGCDSLLEINLSFVEATSSTIVETICEGDTYSFDGNVYSAAGFYSQVIPLGSFMGCDSIVELNLIVEDPSILGMANAGMDEVLCENEVTLNANLPTGTTGFWSTDSDITFDDPTLTNPFLENIPTGTHELKWTVATALCGDYSSDVVTVSVSESLIANEDFYEIDDAVSFAHTLNVLDNDDFEGTPILNVISTPDFGIVDVNFDGTIALIVNEDFEGTATLEYEICPENCPDDCAIALATIEVSKQEIDVVNIPNAITANDDGINDTWIIDMLEKNPSKYENNHLVIFNRWGDKIFEARPYLNNWNGTDINGLDLPSGTYYYNLYLDMSKGIIFRGDVSILR